MSNLVFSRTSQNQEVKTENKSENPTIAQKAFNVIRNDNNNDLDQNPNLDLYPEPKPLKSVAS
jgi:hypothetical protein